MILRRTPRYTFLTLFLGHANEPCSARSCWDSGGHEGHATHTSLRMWVYSEARPSCPGLQLLECLLVRRHRQQEPAWSDCRRGLPATSLLATRNASCKRRPIQPRMVAKHTSGRRVAAISQLVVSSVHSPTLREELTDIFIQGVYLLDRGVAKEKGQLIVRA